MTRDQFQSQLNRLCECFGKAAYGTERCKVIWSEVQNMSAEWFTRTVDDLIGSSRHAPLLPDFRDRISLERERMAGRDKEQHSNDARAILNGTLQEGEMRHISQTIIKRSQGLLNDTEWDAFQNILKGLGL